MLSRDEPHRFSRRKFLKLGSTAAIVAVVAGVGGYLAYQSAQPTQTKIPIAPQTTAPKAITTATPTVTQGRTWRVPEDYSSIDPAKAVASAGDTVQVGPGIYPGFITIDKPLTVKGSGAGVTTIDGLVRIHTHGARLTGFTLKGGGEKNYHAGVIISVDHLGGNEVSGNTIEGTGNGVHLHTGDNTVSNNIIKTAGAGVANHAEIGVATHGGVNNKIVGNTIEAGDVGVIINVGDNNEVRGNTIRLCGVGIFIKTVENTIRTVENTIFENNLLDNKIQAQDDGTNNLWYKDGKGNYWSNWTIPDEDKDGRVDVPYAIPGTAKSVDKYPLASPYQS